MDRLGNLFSLNAFNLFHLNRRAPGNYNIIFQQLFNVGAANILYFFILFPCDFHEDSIEMKKSIM